MACHCHLRCNDVTDQLEGEVQVAPSGVESTRCVISGVTGGPICSLGDSERLYYEPIASVSHTSVETDGWVVSHSLRGRCDNDDGDAANST